MTRKTKIGLEGFDELEKKLLELDAKTGVKAMRQAGRKSLKPVLEYQKEHAGYNNEDREGETEHMRDSIKMTSSKGGRSSRDRVISFLVGPSKKHAQKAIAQEFGNQNQEADPFIRPSLEKFFNQVLSSVKSDLKTAIDKLARKKK